MFETRSKKIASQQAQLDKKTGAESGTPVVTPTATSTDIKPKGKSGWLRKNVWTILAIVLALLIGFQVTRWIGGSDKHNPQKVERTQPFCPDASALETRRAIVTTEWSNWIKPAEGVADNGLYLRYDPQELVICECRLENGISQYRFRAKQGQVLLSYKLVPASQLHLEKLL